MDFIFGNKRKKRITISRFNDLEQTEHQKTPSNLQCYNLIQKQDHDDKQFYLQSMLYMQKYDVHFIFFTNYYFTAAFFFLRCFTSIGMIKTESTQIPPFECVQSICFIDHRSSVDGSEHPTTNSPTL